MHEHVGLVHEGQPPAPPRGQVGRVPDAPLDAAAGVQRLLRRGLDHRAAVHGPAGARVQALGVLPDDHQVEVLKLVPRHGAADARAELGRPQVHVQVEFGAQPEQQAALQDARRHRRVADRAEQDRVCRPQFVQHAVGQHLAGRVPVPRAERVRAPLDPEAAARGDGIDAAPRHRGDLGADPVAGHAGDGVTYLVCHGQAPSPSTGAFSQLIICRSGRPVRSI